MKRLKLLFIPCEANSYRPRILRRKALLWIIAAAIIVEGAMALSMTAHLSFKSFFAAVLPSSIQAFTNDERSAQALPPLVESDVLARAAQRKAEDMASKGYFSHQSPDGRAPWDFMREEGYRYLYAGENLAVHFYDSADVVSAWMASPTHRANIVKPVYKEIGIGIASGLYEGKQTTFVVQFFGTPKSSELSFFPKAAAAEAADVPAEQAVAGESVSDPSVSLVTRIMSSPRSVAVFLLSAFTALLLVGMLLTFIIKIHIQPLDLLGNGALALAALAGLLILNSQLFSPSVSNEQGAAVIEAVER